MPATHHVLIINPNTSRSVTERLLSQLSPGLPEVQLHGATALFGATYIADEYSYCVAGHAVLDAWERAQPMAPPGGYHAVLVGCFGDPGLPALDEVAGIPVLGLAQAAVRALTRQGWQRVAVVTGGEKWQPMLERWSRAAGHDGPGAALQIVQVRTLAATGLQMMQSPDRTAQALAQASAESLQGTDAQAVLLGGAGLAGMGERVRAITGLPVWDCVEAAQQSLQHTLASTARAAVV
ncbi:aspartate/glutamate racemase family protein [Comamonas aquatica]|uniref:aspartate/glutamate racemase family protein n=1 Tax=Comamonas aquatica TaxID=225991 RepID=UPI00244B1056|nr:aspartate/glutamate racemase family protein [Comamonas aquatica]MDH0494873.1 aspartate/glutamate racemase family protein [Comamonas aquatica]